MTDQTLFVLDKNQRRIMPDDVLKVFHFTGARRKKYYMYKIAIAYNVFNGSLFLVIEHIPHGGVYYIQANNCVNPNIEIIQGFSNGVMFNERPKQKAI